MKTYISLLRGINVGGHRPVTMAALKKIYAELKFQNIVTHLQSGNVVFSARTDQPLRLARAISGKIEQELSLKIPVIVLETETLQKIVRNNPFQGDDAKDPAFMHVSFLSGNADTPGNGEFDLRKREGEAWAVTPEAIYLYCPGGYGNSRLTNQWLENRLKANVTTRNWKTTTALLKIAMENRGLPAPASR